MMAGSAVLQNIPSISSTGLITGKYIAILFYDAVCLYFPANFLVISHSCFMFPWADASSASLARSSMEFSFLFLRCS